MKEKYYIVSVANEDNYGTCPTLVKAKECNKLPINVKINCRYKNRYRDEQFLKDVVLIKIEKIIAWAYVNDNDLQLTSNDIETKNLNIQSIIEKNIDAKKVISKNITKSNNKVVFNEYSDGYCFLLKENSDLIFEASSDKEALKIFKEKVKKLSTLHIFEFTSYVIDFETSYKKIFKSFFTSYNPNKKKSDASIYSDHFSLLEFQNKTVIEFSSNLSIKDSYILDNSKIEKIYLSGAYLLHKKFSLYGFRKFLNYLREFYEENRVLEGKIIFDKYLSLGILYTNNVPDPELKSLALPCIPLKDLFLKDKKIFPMQIIDVKKNGDLSNFINLPEYSFTSSYEITGNIGSIPAKYLNKNNNQRLLSLLKGEKEKTFYDYFKRKK